jgi:hypothetical protein
MNTEWKPIASAPKDGTRVLLWNEKFTAPCSGQFYGFDDWKMDSDIPPFAFQPTHWMPLPPAPTSHPIPTGATGEDIRSRVMEVITGVWDRETQIDDAADEVIDMLSPAPAAGDALGDPALQKLFGEAITGALGFGAQGVNPLPVGHWLEPFWNMARADAALAARLALLDHPLLREVLGYVEDAGPADVWGAAQSWMSLRDAAIAQQSKRKEA